MKKLVVIINGNGGVGKDTLCEFAKDAFAIRNISAITPIKEIASAYGWKGEKDAKARKFLADLKAAFIDYNDLPFLYIKEQYHSFLEDEKEEILFIHIREAEEIEKVKKYVQTPCITLLITREQKKNQCWGNPSDDNVTCYTYDYQYSNDKKLVEARIDFTGFLQDVFEKEYTVISKENGKADGYMNDKKEMSWALYLPLGCLIVTIILAIAVFQIYLKILPGEKEEERYDDYYVMIVEDRKSDFWQEVYNGAYAAGLEENIYVDLLGSHISQNYNKYELMEIAIYSNVDGIIVAADESMRMTGLIDLAVSNDIPVVTLYGDNPNSMRCSYVGVGNYELGREYGRQVLELAGEKAVSAAVLVSTQASDTSQNIVWSGIQETISQENDKNADISLSLISVDDSSNFTVEESIRDIFMKESLPDIIICLNAVNTTCLYQALIDYNKVGEISILGYYDNDTILKGIERNVITSTIAIDTNQMGKYCIDALTEYKQFGNTSEYFMADITLINKKNVSDFMGGMTDD